MAKIVQALTRASKEYDQKTFQSLVRDLDAVINKLNTTFQEELKQEVEFPGGDTVEVAIPMTVGFFWPQS